MNYSQPFPKNYEQETLGDANVGPRWKARVSLSAYDAVTGDLEATGTVKAEDM